MSGDEQEAIPVAAAVDGEERGLSSIADGAEMARGMLVLSRDSDGSPTIRGIEGAISAFSDMRALVAAYPYDGSDEERKANNAAMAKVRKARDAADRQIRDWERMDVATLEEQRKALRAAADDVISLMQERKQASDDAWRASREAEVKDIVDGALDAGDPDGVIPESVGWRVIADDGWFNRSKSIGGHSGVMGEAQRRVEMLVKVADAGDRFFPGWDMADKAELLSDCGWDMFDATNEYDRREEAKAAAAAVEAHRREVAAAARAKRDSTEILSVRVPKGRSADAVAAIRAAGIECERL